MIYTKSLAQSGQFYWHDPFLLSLSTSYFLLTLCFLYQGVPQMAQWQRICLPMQELQETCVSSLGREIPWRRKWQLTLVGLPEKSDEQRSLVGYSRRVRHDWATEPLTQFFYQMLLILLFNQIIISDSGIYGMLWRPVLSTRLCPSKLQVNPSSNDSCSCQRGDFYSHL